MRRSLIVFGLLLSACAADDPFPAIHASPVARPTPPPSTTTTLSPAPSLAPPTTNWVALGMFIGQVEAYALAIAPPHQHASAGSPTPEQWAALRRCESGDNYTTVSASGTYRGAYQFSQSTWDSVAPAHLVGVDPTTTSPADQDATALSLWYASGWSPWPHCGVATRS